jgi:mannose-1-phosphate guanylyltransferase/mannose-6-phosphate isomerase
MRRYRVGGEGSVTTGERVYAVRGNESTFIPVGSPQRLENPGSEPLRVIEVECGEYLDEDDIVRTDDHPGRGNRV